MILQAKVKSNSSKFQIERKNNQIIIYCKSPAENNKANLEIIKELQKLTKQEVKIVKGLTSKKKNIFIQNITEKEFNELI